MTDPFDRLAATLADRYTLEREIGQGGMATVYLAHDVRHKRKVAVKVLRPELAAILGSERFLKEIEVTAGLQHPNILPLYDSGAAGLSAAISSQFLYYVMPWMEGETLRERLIRERQLPVDEAMEIAKAVLAAVGYAHSKGVIHRDIKPENILFQGGQAIVADFGIALAVSQAGGTRLTETGLSIGTPQYMSPEQATGEHRLDGRSDLYSVGVVLYEMLAGSPPHSGPTAQAVIAAVINEKPVQLDVRRETVPSHVVSAVARALQKLPADRFSSAASFAAALSAAPSDVTSLSREAATRSSGLSWITDWRTLATLTAVLALAIYAFWPRVTRRESNAPVARFVVPLPPGADVKTDLDRPMAISPDGRRLAYVGAVTGADSVPPRLYVRTLDRFEPEALDDTDSAQAPFFSPDGEWIAFYVGTRIRKMPWAGGRAATVAEGARTFMAGAAWLDDNSIVFPSAFGELTRVHADGTGREVVFSDTTAFVSGPIGVPSGRIVMWYCHVVSCIEQHDLVRLDPSTGELTVLAPGFGRSTPERAPVVAYVPPGFLLVSKPDDPSLFAMAVDARRDGLTVSQPPRPVLEGAITGHGFAVSRSGTLAYLTGASGTRLVLVDRQGRESTITDQIRSYLFPRFSPDGKRIAVEIHDQYGGQIWIFDRSSGTLTRLTSEGHNTLPVFSPDGRWVAYTSGRDTLGGVYRVPVDRSAPEEAVFDAVRLAVTDVSWSPDSLWMLFTDYGAGGTTGVYSIAADGSGTPEPVLDGPANEDGAVFSPDGKWMAFVSDESGAPEVYVRRFSGSSGRWAVSSGGGDNPAWPPPGDELYYEGFDGLYAARLELDPEPRVIGRTRLFGLEKYAPVRWDVGSGGSEFVMVKAIQENVQLVVVLNWIDELTARSP